MAVANYEDTHKRFPPAYQLGPDGQPWHSWRVLVLPYIEQDPLFKTYRFDEPWDGPNNSQLAGLMPKTFAFHNKHRPGLTTNYLAVVGKDTMWPGSIGRKRDEITDGSGESILIVENYGLGVHWMEPRDLDFETMSYDFNHPHGLSSWYKYPAVAMADGFLHSFSQGYDRDTLRSMLNVRDKPKPADPAVQPLPDGRMREKVRD